MGGRSKEMTTFISYLASTSIVKAGLRGRKRRQASLLHALRKSNNRIQSDKQSDDAIVQLPEDLKSMSFASWYQSTIIDDDRRKSFFTRRKRLPMIREEWGRRYSAPPNLMITAPFDREDERLTISSSDDETTS